jgi:flagellar biosynthesis/type III secretory pathway protein FliH
MKLSERGYGTAKLLTHEADDYADLGFPGKPTGFSADHYQPLRQPLSKQAQASLAMLEDEYRNEVLGQEHSPSIESSDTNEHMPFVMDLYAATRKSKLRVKVDAATLQRAVAHAEMAENLVVSPITPADENARDTVVVIEDTFTATKVEADSAQEPVSPDVPVLPALPAVVGGVAPEEVAQREAEQFAKGLAQGREEGKAEGFKDGVEKGLEKAKTEGYDEGLRIGHEKGLAEGLEKGRVEAEEKTAAHGEEQFAKGKAEGHEAGLNEGLAQGKTQAREEALQEGIALGEQQAREAMAAEMAAQRVLFETAAKELSALLNDSKKFFEPLKRLSVHVAEQLVLGELSASSKAVERLVQRCLDELDHPVQGAVVLELNPEDKVRLQEQAGDFIKGMRLEAVPNMQPGSVRVFANDTVVEDLVEHRLETLARSMSVDVDKLRDKSQLAKEIEDKNELKEEGDDVHS